VSRGQDVDDTLRVADTAGDFSRRAAARRRDGRIECEGQGRLRRATNMAAEVSQETCRAVRDLMVPVLQCPADRFVSPQAKGQAQMVDTELQQLPPSHGCR
jgi:hypothetical protein